MHYTSYYLYLHLFPPSITWRRRPIGSPPAGHSPQSLVVVQELCHISPLPASTNSSHLTFPLTHFDLFWLRTQPVERLYFYPLPPDSSTPAFFNSVILPTLKQSLSTALSHLLPLAAALTLPASHSATPFLLYAPSSAGVPLTVAVSADDFHHLCSTTGHIRPAGDSRPYLPALPSPDSEAPLVALQITFFPNQGFSVGMSSHHAVADGKSTSLFVNAWAYLSRTATATTLPEELTPFLDRSVVNDPENLGLAFFQYRTKQAAATVKSSATAAAASKLVRATFLLSQERLQILMERVVAATNSNNEEKDKKKKKIRLSRFVLAFAHSIVCMVKAKGLTADRVFHYGFMADARGRLEPSLPANYLGNCVAGRNELMEVKPLLAGGVGYAAERISGLIDGAEENILGMYGVAGLLRFRSNMEASGGVFIVVAGSPSFRVYDSDFGWGRPRFVEVTSVDRTAGAISMAECRDGGRGIEVGLALPPEQMEIFRSLFVA